VARHLAKTPRQRTGALIQPARRQHPQHQTSLENTSGATVWLRARSAWSGAPRECGWGFAANAEPWRTSGAVPRCIAVAFFRGAAAARCGIAPRPRRRTAVPGDGFANAPPRC
jgi:hypothetical protein